MTSRTMLSRVLLALFLGVGLTAAAFGLSIDSPQGSVSSPVAINITANQTQDTIVYTVLPGNLTNSCSNCSSLTDSLNLSPGAYTIGATQQLGNATESVNGSFTVLAPPVPDFTLTLADPQNQTYNVSVPVGITTNTTVDTLQYVVDGGAPQSCSACAALNATLNVSNGTHVLAATGVLGNVTHQQNVTFTVGTVTNQTNQTNETNQTTLSLSVLSPIAQQYTGAVLFSFATNMPSDISYTLNAGNATAACANCTSYAANQTLAIGNYSLVVFAVAGNQSVNTSVPFSVANQTTNQTNGTGNQTNQTNGTPRFDTGFEKLPQLLESGQINDTTLAEIIRTHKLNPGILNRLIKTGKLGPESTSAIIETQKTPPGILRKLLGFFGFHFEEPHELLAEHGNLTEQQAAELLVDEDLSPAASGHLHEQLAKKHAEQESSRKQDSKSVKSLGSQQSLPPGPVKKATQSSKTPPGQAKKETAQSGSDKIPPGLAKKESAPKATGSVISAPGQAKKETSGSSSRGSSSSSSGSNRGNSASANGHGNSGNKGHGN